MPWHLGLALYRKTQIRRESLGAVLAALLEGARVPGSAVAPAAALQTWLCVTGIACGVLVGHCSTWCPQGAQPALGMGFCLTAESRAGSKTSFCMV